jgi:hypothetical protein
VSDDVFTGYLIGPSEDSGRCRLICLRCTDREDGEYVVLVWKGGTPVTELLTRIARHREKWHGNGDTT